MLRKGDEKSAHQKHTIFNKKHKKKKPSCDHSQEVNVTVTVNEKDDDDSPVKGCFKMLCGAGKKAATM